MNLQLFKKFSLFNPELVPGVCGSITAGVALSCTDKMIGGVVDRLILFNRGEIAGYTRNGTDPQIIEAITMVATKKGYAYEGKQQSIEPKQTLIKKRYDSPYDHEIRFKIFNVSPAIKQQIELMVNGNIVAIVENNFQNAAGSAAFEIYGVDAGLYVESLERTPGDTELMGAYDIVLKSHENAKEGHLPAALFITDYATTLALVNALL